ncbi:MAG TPA: transposase [Acidimicrobiales bacterium]|nr:transposase [Acidimicrobiales bacterium]
MKRFVGGPLQAELMARAKGLDPARCLVVPVDVGKWSAMALVADHYGEVVVAPFEFALSEPGVRELLAAIEKAGDERAAQMCRAGVEAAGHYHRTLVARLGEEGIEVLQLNPAAVKEARSQQLLRTLKSDQRDLGAMAELMVRGGGRPAQGRSDALAAQLAWVVHRRRKLSAHQVLANQVQSQLDLVFPGLDRCFSDLLGSKAGRVILADICDPDRICRLGPERLRAFVAHRGVRMSRPKAAQVVQAAREALRLPDPERAVLGQVLEADVALLGTTEAELARAEAALAELLPQTPAKVLTSLPGVGVVRASAYGAGIGDPWRFRDASAAYRASGLVPTQYESAGRRRRRGQHISREGSVILREAIIELGKGLTGHDPDFAAYRRRLVDEQKKTHAVAAVAAGRRAHRLAFAMLRSQEPYDPKRWLASLLPKKLRRRQRAGQKGPAKHAQGSFGDLAQGSAPLRPTPLAPQAAHAKSPAVPCPKLASPAGGTAGGRPSRPRGRRPGAAAGSPQGGRLGVPSCPTGGRPGSGASRLPGGRGSGHADLRTAKEQHRPTPPSGPRQKGPGLTSH